MEENGNETLPDEQQSQLTYEEKVANANVIAKPMATKNVAKKIYKVIKKASKYKKYTFNGLKDVQKALKKGEKGVLIIAGDVSPVDMICHLPAVCEDRNVPYCYTPSKQDLGSNLGKNRTLVTLLIKEHDDYKDLFNELKEQIKLLPSPL